MKSFTINTRSRSNLFALTIIALSVTLLFTPRTGHTQQMQRGVSVQMAVTTSAASVPAADNEDAWIVAVTGDNDIYFGIDPVTPQDLLDTMKTRPRNRSQELYIKADGRASFATVEQVLAAARKDLFKRVVLLTGQSSGAEPGTTVPPKGLTVQLFSTAPAAVMVEIAPSHGSPTLRIDSQEVPLKALQHKLEELLQDRREVVALKPGNVPFADVVHVVDVCHMSGGVPVLLGPEL